MSISEQALYAIFNLMLFLAGFSLTFLGGFFCANSLIAQLKLQVLILISFFFCGMFGRLTAFSPKIVIEWLKGTSMTAISNRLYIAARGRSLPDWLCLMLLLGSGWRQPLPMLATG